MNTHTKSLYFRGISFLITLVALLLFVNVPTALAHPADITVTDFFVERDWDNIEIEDTHLRAVHSINWFEAMEKLDPDPTVTAEAMVADLNQYETTIALYLEDNLTVTNAGERCSFENIFIPPQTAPELMAVGFFFNFDIVCEAPIGEITVTADFLLEKYPLQSNFVTFYRFPGNLIATDSLSVEKPTVTQVLGNPEANQTPADLLATFVYEGVRHIVPLGLDHILFIATVFLIAGSVRRVVLYSLLFTVAHSITLALTVFGVIVPSSSWIEAIIALSIIILAIDAIYPFVPRLWQGAVIFGFGLFHGMGFASVLTELGLPDGAEALALFGFNVGVEIGQLGIILLLYAVTWWLFLEKDRKRLTTIIIASIIALIATYWLIERTLF